jgi:hypothetical protein
MKKVSSVSKLVGQIAYGVVSISLFLISFIMMGVALWDVWNALQDRTKLVTALLDSIGFIVIAMAVFDVSKFLVEEEVLGSLEKESPMEQRARLMRFLVIITIAISLEALVFIFNTAKTDIRTLIYPTLLLIADVLMVISLGVYHRLTRDASPTSTG